ncbi:hypothetical protein F2P81_014663 [Scophthalmus maximus]|uniref:Uncharacterized protein n=1 Tax=Scophthalmus maximus TaxID=52904 RepID=A0A6A4SDY6_SCOMX|nr:hypothetical protein F2P81_014663 [Scophthalmus maximus]
MRSRSCDPPTAGETISTTVCNCAILPESPLLILLRKDEAATTNTDDMTNVFGIHIRQKTTERRGQVFRQRHQLRNFPHR